MGGGSKKHKRGSVPSSTVASTTELIQRRPENDYGVLSDPDENNPSSPVPLLTKQDSDDATHEVSQNGAAEPAEDSCTPSEPSQPLHSPQRTQQQEQLSSREQSPSPQQSSPSLQSQKQQNQSPSKSLDALKLKLSRDKNFSRKMTLHTFFSYVILAIEMQRSCSASIARISPQEVETLITYMIEHHSATEDVKSYLRTLVETKVIRNLIEAVIEFNKDQTDALDKLLTTEEIELQETNARDASAATTTTTGIATANIPPDTPVTVTITTTTTTSETQNEKESPQTPQSTGFFQRMRIFFSRCCACK